MSGVKVQLKQKLFLKKGGHKTQPGHSALKMQSAVVFELRSASPI